MSRWLNQFWLFSFKTAKCWGRGPRNWTAESLRLDLSQAISPAPIPDSPGSDAHGTTSQSTNETMPKPSPLCRWSIHYSTDLYYEPCRSRTPSPDPDPDPVDEFTWKPWPTSWSEPPYQARLLNSLESNDFSSIKADSLPIAVPQMVRVLQKPNDEAIEEAFGFCIMAQNNDLLGTLCEELMSKDEIVVQKIRTSNLVHLATTYVNGSKVCCKMLERLLWDDDLKLNFRLGNENSLGHTVIDNLMIAVLKAHTNIPPGMVDESLRDEKRFPGEEVDICGRWDADSDCIRALINAGTPSIPFTWKHKFCHTSVQTINHCLTVLNSYSTSIADVGIATIPSGLFKKLCISCGRQLQLYPLHTLVLTGFGLAQFGHRDEDLFGLVAILLSMLSAGTDPRRTADISALALFPEEDSDTSGCTHEELTPAQFADRIPTRLVETWSKDVQTGWSLFCHVLWIAEREWRTNSLPFYSIGKVCYFGERTDLATLWAAVQTELLTYRRLREGDPWISANLDMNAILESLINDRPISTGLLDQGMMNPLSRCGCFSMHHPGSATFFPRIEDVAKYHFSNLEDWSRTTFLDDRIINSYRVNC